MSSLVAARLPTPFWTTSSTAPINLEIKGDVSMRQRLAESEKSEELNSV